MKRKRQWSRREWLSLAASGLVAASACRMGPKRPIALDEFDPESMLQLPESPVPKARFSVIDFHTHLSWSAIPLKPDGAYGERMDLLGRADELLEIMDDSNVKAMVNVTGGVGDGLERVLDAFDRKHPGRFYTLTEPSWNDFTRPDFATFQAEAIERAHRAGARGLKLTKNLGLYLREHITEGPLVAVDDRRFDPMWEVCAALELPVGIHVGDPDAFFMPVDRFNERYEELSKNPEWSFYGRDFPSKISLLEARNRVFERHPRTQFVAFHVANRAEDLQYVSDCLDRYPNVCVEIGARISELGRQPRAARRFFDRYQDRILFGTDAFPEHAREGLHRIYFRFLETLDEHFDYAATKKPPQGRWRIYGLGLPDTILEKVYRDNACRLLRL